MKSPLRIFNTASRKTEIFKPLRNKTVGLYTCGPTVYNFAHIGNLRTYIFEDILERVLAVNGYKVKRVMNITDVGHLTGDSDHGEDKMEKEAVTRAGVARIARKYTRAFLADIKKLNIRKPPILAPATKFVPQQINLIKELLRKGYAYETEKAIYFHVPKFKKYGKLSGQSLQEKMTAAREEVVADPDKRHSADFAVWFKLVGKFAHHLQWWPSPWGKGFPGWHIECSAISRKFLSQPFDIHTGGVDHIGTHHENEIAQSEAAYGTPLAKYWMHGEFLLVNDAKMAKSAGNFFTLGTLEEKNIPPLAYRYLVLGAHYRSKLSFSWKSLGAAEKGLSNLRDTVRNLKKQAAREKMRKPGFRSASLNAFHDAFRAALNDDLNTAKALATVWTVVRDPKLSAREKIGLIREFDGILGLDLLKSPTAPSADSIPPELEALAAQRENARKAKNFAAADALRAEIESLGFTVQDTPDGPQITPR